LLPPLPPFSHSIDGKAFGLEILQVPQPGAEVTYRWPKPPVSGDGAYSDPTPWGGLENWGNDPMRETSYATRIDDHVCGVDYCN